MKNTKIYAFIDSNNLYQGVKKNIPKYKYIGWEIDLKKFLVYLRNKYKVQKAFLFIGYIKKNKRMYTNLKNYGYTLIFKPTITYKEDRGKRKIKGNIDAELVLHTMIEINNFDKAIIVSGDGDYRCLIEYLVEKKKLKNIFIPNQKSYSSLLIPYREYMIFMNQLRGKLKA
ncbi:MAG: NYN domain-containing protein [Candidatus Dojkabacteria bacterium]|jgi:uncharacterized LabA/DUF88 family protein